MGTMQRPTPRRPEFFILGAGKCGTTSLYDALSQHPQIFMPVTKEPSFYCDIFQVVKNPIEYVSLFAEARADQLAGEASHVYLTCPASAPAIRAFHPDAKFILIFRDPVDRAYSLYNHMTRHGYERIGSFEEALEVEPRRATDSHFRMHNPQYFYNFLYYESGLYGAQIERYFQYFDREQFFFTTMDRLKRDPVGLLGEVFAFLGVDRSFVPRIERQNIGAAARSIGLQFYFRNRLAPVLRWLESEWGPKVIGRLMALNTRPSVGSLDSRVREALRARYADDLRRLEGLTGLDLSAWIAGPSRAGDGLLC
jgi:hypothetical protein